MHLVFYFKFLLANVALALNFFVIYGKSPLLESRRPHLAIVIYYALRLAILAVLLLGLKFGYSAENMSMYYFNAESVLKGGMPNRDFYTLYGVLFPYLMAGSVWIWHSRFALVILLQAVEFVAVYAIFTQKNLPLTLRSFLIYAFNPLILVWIWIGLANQVMCLFAVVAAVALRSETARSLLYALTFASSKIFSLWTIIPALLCQRFRSMVVFGVTLIVIYVPFLCAGSTGMSLVTTEANGTITDATNEAGILSLVGLIAGGAFPIGRDAPDPEVHGGTFAGRHADRVLAAVPAEAGEGKIADRTGPDVHLDFCHAADADLPGLRHLHGARLFPGSDHPCPGADRAEILGEVGPGAAGGHLLLSVSVVFLVWFHFAEFGNPQPRTSWLFDFILIVENALTYWLCGRCAYLAFTYYRSVLKNEA